MAYSKPPVDTGRPHPARVHDFLLGGRDNYAADRQAAGRLPREAARLARQNRAFMRRAVGWLASVGIDQYLDVGSGIPTEPNLHQIVQRVNPASRIVYADNDPLVLRHARARLAGSPQGATAYVQADVREPAALLESARPLLDLGRPVALTLIALLHFVPDGDDPHRAAATLVGALPSGSYLALSHGTLDFAPRPSAGSGSEAAAGSGAGAGARPEDGRERGHADTVHHRGRAEVARFFAGLDLVEPGLVAAPLWYKGTPRPEDETSGAYAGVARIP
ncbi:SAM-dependent methyltransferase [Streptomyces fuscigenes]|uniref:SAM-dependent methyltransferase n=1 Tax=Streptomyces fuscigenes TaxID=1528880 RepID=UPI001F3207AB|nr:SAM-dependent methyltransferase [Streptomyces fuscigenes]MCF3964008.1 SAM-dependent methyltransferase [Streptomyces fuscigenes]